MTRRVESKKPRMEDVFTAFQNFQSRSIRVVNGTMPGSAAYNREMERATEDFHEELRKLNIAQHIDWSE